MRVARNILKDTCTVFGALLRRLFTGKLPESGYTFIPFSNMAAMIGVSR
jgi:hypothetical protein